MNTKSLLLFTIVFATFIFPHKLWGQRIIPQITQEEPPTAEEDSIVLRPFPSARITEAFSASSNLITQSGKKHLTKEAISKYTSEVDTLLHEINGFLGDSAIASLERLAARELDQVIAHSKILTGRLDDLQGRLSAMTLVLESESQLLLKNKERWQLTLDNQKQVSTPESRTERMGLTIHKLDSVSGLLQEDIALIVEGQDLLADRKLKLEDLVDAAKERKAVLGKNLLSKDMPGFFKDLPNLGDPGLLSSHVAKFKSAVRSDYNVLKSDYRRPLIIAALFLVFLLVFSIWFKRNYARLISGEDFHLSEMHMSIINSPVVTTVFVITLMIRFLLADLPQTFYFLNIIILMVPLAILSIRIFGSAIRTWIIVLTVVYGILFFYELTYQPGPLLRIILIIICFVGLWLFIWLFRNKPFSKGFTNKSVYHFFRWLILVFAGLQFFAIIANLAGAFRLAEFLCILPLQITVLAIGIQVASKLANDIVYLALSSKLLQKVNVFKEDMQVIHRKIVWLVDLLLFLFFLTMMLQIFLLKDAIFDWGRGVLTESKNIWNIDFTLGNILIFFFVIWLSIIITRIITHILQKDVFTRVTTAKGIPDTINLLLRIALITGGFFLAAGAAGMKLTNLSIILGAFSVGIGFGLQNIFNNMVSGLILAFERPIKVGDVVQVGELMGTVKSIGLRSSNVRSFDGAEVIVPNGNLISNQMINWTLSDSFRRMDIRVGVAYGSDPEAVLKLMKETTTDYPEIRKDPAPKAYFLGFGESSLDFRLLAWVHLDVRLEVESRLRVDINRTLKDAGIEIPFPQRDLHIRSDATQAKAAAKPVAKPAVKTKPGPDTSN